MENGADLENEFALPFVLSAPTSHPDQRRRHRSDSILGVTLHAQAPAVLDMLSFPRHGEVVRNVKREIERRHVPVEVNRV